MTAEVRRTLKRIGRKLARYRREKRLTQKQVAARARIDQAELSRIERGMEDMLLSTLIAVACAVGGEIVIREKNT